MLTVCECVGDVVVLVLAVPSMCVECSVRTMFGVVESDECACDTVESMLCE